MTRAFTLIELPAVRNLRLRSGQEGFTLIELLVVITIIVVLLALLTPALDKAIYQASLAVCATNQKALATSSSVYAAGNRRTYPRVMAERARAAAREICQEDDTRPLIRDYLSINGVFNDPLAPQKMEWDKQFPGQVVWQWTETLWYAGWGVDGEAGHKAMRKVGDRMTYTPPVDPNAGKRFQFNAMAADLYQRWISVPLVTIAHPDKQGRLPPVVGRGDENVFTHAGFGAAVQSIWEGPLQELTMDQNVAFQDGAVLRYNDVRIGQSVFGDWDERFAPHPVERVSERYPDLMDFIPPR